MSIQSVAVVQTIVLAVQTIVLAWTAILIARYTSETAELRKESARLNKLSLRPIVLPEFPVDQVPGNGASPRFALRNCGVGCAVNVRALSVTTNDYAEGVINFGQIQSRFASLNYLPASERIMIQLETYADGQKLEASPFMYWFHPARPGTALTVEIQYEDIEGARYVSRAAIADEHTIANLPRKVTIQVQEVRT